MTQDERAPSDFNTELDMARRDNLEELKLDRMEKLLATASESIQNLVLDGEDFKKLARSTVKLTLKAV